MKKTLTFIAAAAILASCGSGKDLSKAVVGNWTITEASGTPVEEGFEKPVINFGDNGEMNGNTSINNFFGGYAVKGDKISFSAVGVTKMAGPTGETERAVLDALNEVEKVKVENDSTIVLCTSDGTVAMKLVRQ